MLEIDGKIFRNLQEQVLKNKEDIERYKELTNGVVGIKGDTGDTGPQGPIGPQGLAGSQWKVGSSEPSEGDYWLSTNGLVYGRTNGVWTALMSIRGPQGVKGNKGDIGLTGPQGEKGDTGATGPVGATLTIRGAVASVDLLPNPLTQATNTAYLVGSADNYDLYQIIVIGENDDETQWLLVGQYGFINQADVEDLQNRMTAQETKQGQNEQYISRLTQDIETLQNNVTNLGTEHTNINQRITTNANNISALQTTTTNLNANKENLIRYVTISSPAGTTQGTLGAVDLAVLLASKQNCIIFDNQIYRLQDNEHNSGVLTYTYVGYDTEMVSKTITITISTLAWTLSTLEIESGGTEVVANNGETTSATLNTLKVGDTNYSVPQGGGGGGVQTITATHLETAPFTFQHLTLNSPITMMGHFQLNSAIINDKTTILNLIYGGEQIASLKYDEYLKCLAVDFQGNPLVAVPYSFDNMNYVVVIMFVVGCATLPILTNATIDSREAEIIKNLANYNLISLVSTNDLGTPSLSGWQKMLLTMGDYGYQSIITVGDTLYRQGMTYIEGKITTVSKGYILTPATT